MRRFHFSERPDSFEIDPQHQLAQQLVFAGLGRYNGGLYYHDSSLYGNHGTLTNMDPATDWVRDLGRAALDFDCVNDYVTGQYGPQYPDALTVHCWATVEPFVSTYHRTLIARSHFGDTFRGCRLMLGNQLYSGGKTVYWMTSADGTATETSTSPAGTTVSDGSWQAFAGRFLASTDHSVWRNGVRVGTTAAAAQIVQTATYPWTIGYYSGGQFMRGKIADAMIWSRALSPSEISALADPGNVMLSLGGSDPGLLRYRRKWWPVVSGAAVGKYWLWARRNSQVIGSGLGV